MNKGLTIIYWGWGKGKTTAAIGVALRALGHGKKVLFMQFMKGEEWKTGEAMMFEKMENIELCIAGKGWVKIMGDQKPIEEHTDSAKKGLEYATEQIENNKWDVVVLDEVLSAVDAELITIGEVKELIKVKPEGMSLIMTGHEEYKELIELADTVTRMEKIKHPYDKGIKAMEGIDY